MLDSLRSLDPPGLFYDQSDYRGHGESPCHSLPYIGFRKSTSGSTHITFSAGLYWWLTRVKEMAAAG